MNPEAPESPPPHRSRARPEPSRVTEIWFEEPTINALAVILWIVLELSLVAAMYGCTALLGH